MKRYCESFIIDDLKKKMVFVGGPRQVGKTTLAKSIAQSAYHSAEYLNWDFQNDKRRIQKNEWLQNSDLVIFDELHKFPRWKQWIKGIYDTKPEEQNYLVTGSARLDVYRQGGDSLMGRYHYWRLHPFSIDELPLGMKAEEAFERLLQLGGFPEPFLSNDERQARRWRKERFDRVLREDIRDLERIREIQLLYLFSDALRNRAGQLITLSNIAEDLQISPKTAKSWLGLFEKMYVGFAIYPLTKSVPRSIQKPAKFFFYDNADIENNLSARLENLVATTLLKRLHFIEDYHGYSCQLHYIRDKEGREVDFATVINGQLYELIEVKLSDTDLSLPLQYYANKLKPLKAVQLVGNLRQSFDSKGIQVRHPIEYFKDPPWIDLSDPLKK